MNTTNGLLRGEMSVEVEMAPGQSLGQHRGKLLVMPTYLH